jgi:hypothetical protein
MRVVSVFEHGLRSLGLARAAGEAETWTSSPARGRGVGW